MRYYGSEAYDLDAQEMPWPSAPWPSADGRSLTMMDGGSLDARARQGVSPAFSSRVVLALAALVLFVALGSVRVALTTGTVSLLQANEAVSSQIKEYRLANDDLRIECSLLCRSERIGRIATQNLGMVHASEAERLVLD